MVGPEHPGDQGRCLTHEEEEDYADEHDGRVGSFSLPGVQLFASLPRGANGADEQSVQNEQNHEGHPAHEDHVEPRVVKDLEPHVLANGGQVDHGVVVSGRSVARAPAPSKVADRSRGDLDCPIFEELGQIEEEADQGQD